MNDGQQVCKRFWISGKVQGVYFRASARELARRLALRGWISNLPDGRVAVLAQGSGPAIAEFEQWLARGPDGARVSAVLSEISADEPAAGFEVR